MLACDVAFAHKSRHLRRVGVCTKYGGYTTNRTRQTTLNYLQLSVGGMHCGSCSSAIQRALESLPGVHSAAVNLLSESASVRYNPSTIDVAALVQEVEDCGFQAEVCLLVRDACAHDL